MVPAVVSGTDASVVRAARIGDARRTVQGHRCHSIQRPAPSRTDATHLHLNLRSLRVGRRQQPAHPRHLSRLLLDDGRLRLHLRLQLRLALLQQLDGGLLLRHQLLDHGLCLHHLRVHGAANQCRQRVPPTGGRAQVCGQGATTAANVGGIAVARPAYAHHPHPRTHTPHPLFTGNALQANCSSCFPLQAALAGGHFGGAGS